jgi:hypothetical protein
MSPQWVCSAQAPHEGCDHAACHGMTDPTAVGQSLSGNCHMHCFLRLPAALTTCCRQVQLQAYYRITQDSKSKLFRCTVYLPSSSGLLGPVTPPAAADKKKTAAKNRAALFALTRLHEEGKLNDCLLPVWKSNRHSAQLGKWGVGIYWPCWVRLALLATAATVSVSVIGVISTKSARQMLASSRVTSSLTTEISHLFTSRCSLLTVVSGRGRVW